MRPLSHCGSPPRPATRVRRRHSLRDSAAASKSSSWTSRRSTRTGRPVRGLTASDFTVLEDGQPQSIVQFTADRHPRSAAGADRVGARRRAGGAGQHRRRPPPVRHPARRCQVAGESVDREVDQSDGALARESAGTVRPCGRRVHVTQLARAGFHERPSAASCCYRHFHAGRRLVAAGVRVWRRGRRRRCARRASPAVREHGFFL